MRVDKNFKAVLKKEYLKEKIFILSTKFALFFAILVLVSLLIDVFLDGAGRLSWKFITSFPSRKPGEAGLYSALIGSLWVGGLTAVLSLPVGIGAAIYLEEFAPKNWITEIIEINIANLAGIPSIIYGILGLELFVRVCGLGQSVLAGSLTLALLVLPIIIIASREAIRAVPRSLRLAAFALGATRWQAFRDVVLPISLPGMMTGTILAMSRALGETAPLITIGALTYVAFLPDGILSPFSVLPIQIFNWVSRPQSGFHTNAAAGIIILLAVTLLLNAIALVVRNYLGRKYSRLRD